MKGLIFDCFGVLYGGGLQSLFNICPEDRYAELRDANKQVDYGFIDQDDYIRIVAGLCGKSDFEIAELLRLKHIRNDEMVDYVRQMRGQYRTAMLSNVGSGVLDSLFSEAELAELFDTVVLSHQEHMTKPHPQIFRLTAERLGLAPDECLLIDDLAMNCDGAEVTGMQAIQHVSNQLTFKHIDEVLNGS